jgi:Sensors of blue-light using FAD
MVRNAEVIYTCVFLCISNPRTSMTETQTRAQQLRNGASTDSVTGMVLAAKERWLCYLEGNATQVKDFAIALERIEQPRHWHLLMHNSQSKQRSFPQHALGWRNASTPLEMAAFICDLKRNTSHDQIWHVPFEQIVQLFEPSE